ncbi:MAG: hypothetical protein KGP34_03200 [Bacteroidetes bacterium]|nr:hypothetical protein [Bacteroidota bacterium]
MLQRFQNSNKTSLLCILATVAMALSSQVAMAQPPPPPDDPNNVGGGTGGAGVPIDGGLSILMAAGAGLGLKKAWDARKSTPTEGDSEASDEEPSATAGPLDS